MDLWQKLEPRAKKLETALAFGAHPQGLAGVSHGVTAPRRTKMLFLLYHSSLKPVQERLRDYFQKYLPAVQEITPEEWATVEGKPGTPRYAKAREAFHLQPPGLASEENTFARAGDGDRREPRRRRRRRTRRTAEGGSPYFY